ncbi:MAG: hypothetical protein KAT37_04390 [Candidatus Aenigmarchaeota archaeon]|nr:hypothetical protein [Candidatus Aenigmarchaeota archaeon]
MSEGFYEIKDEDIKIFNKNRLHQIPLHEDEEFIGKYIIIRPKNDTKYPNEIEVLPGPYMWGKALLMDEKSTDKTLQDIKNGKVSQNIVKTVEQEGYDITYDGGGA